MFGWGRVGWRYFRKGTAAQSSYFWLKHRQQQFPSTLPLYGEPRPAGIADHRPNRDFTPVRFEGLFLLWTPSWVNIIQRHRCYRLQYYQIAAIQIEFAVSRDYQNRVRRESLIDIVRSTSFRTVKLCSIQIFRDNQNRVRCD